ncbi:MAG: LPS assembly lipoprotein LptE [Anaeromyxobacteraceae bacterium]
MRLVALGLALVLSGCGYGFAAGVGRLPPGAEHVFVRPLEDHTTDAELGGLVAAALRGELARRGADGGPGGRARIEGAVEESTFGPSSPNGSTWRAVLVVSARLVIDGTVARESRARREEDWLAGQDPLESEGRRRLALRRAAAAIARDVVERFENP